MKFVGLDVGEKRIGVARADSSTRIAVPVGFIEVDGGEWQKIAKIANLYNTNLFVIGLPRSNQGNETAQSGYVRQFAQALTKNLPGAKIYLQDESLTSVVAEERLKNSRKLYQKGDIDTEAATIILQDFLESFKTGVKNEIEAAAGQNGSGQGGMGQNGAGSQMASAGAASQSTPVSPAKPPKTNAKKGKSKMKKATKWLISLIILAILGVGATGAALYFRDKVRGERAEYYAAKEAEMAAEVFDFTILPGETLADIRDKLIEVGYTSAEVDKALSSDYDFDFLAERPEGASLEGYLFGETKQFYKDTPVTEVIEFYLGEMDKTIKDNALEAKFAEQGLTLLEGITLASVVQKEAPTSEMPTVAQVFLSRLAAGIPLGSDVTVSYALDTIDPDRDTHVGNQEALGVDSCYNTRLYAGLPCGPISNPGLEALLAVAEPSDTSYLYFLTGDDGLMYYSYTEDEHIQNAALYCQDLCKVSL